jgi:hypothetical protein
MKLLRWKKTVHKCDLTHVWAFNFIVPFSEERVSIIFLIKIAFCNRFYTLQ